MSKKYKHLNLSPHWQQYFSKYPQGYTIIENLIDWVSQVNKMVDSYNELTEHVDNFKESVNNTTDGFREELDVFLGQFDDNLTQTVVTTLSEWQNSGFLDVVIDSALETKYHEMDERLTTQLAQTEKNINSRAINVLSPPFPMVAPKGDGVTDDTEAIQNILDLGQKVFFPTPEVEYMVSEPLTLNTIGQEIEGESREHTKIKQINNEDLFVINEFQIKISSLHLSGVADNITYQNSAIKINYGVRTVIENNVIDYFGYGISNDSGEGAWTNNFTGNYINYCRNAGIYLPSLANITNIQNNEIRGCRYGVVLAKLDGASEIVPDYLSDNNGGINITGNTIQGNSEVDVVVGIGNFSTSIVDNYFETTTNQPFKKWVIQLGTDTDRNYAMQTIIDNNFFSNQYNDFPLIKLFRFSGLSVKNNSSITRDQVFLDTSDLSASGDIDYATNYVNGGKRISDVNKPHNMSKTIYPLTKNSGGLENYYQFDHVESEYKLGLAISSRFSSGVTFNSPVYIEGKFSLPTKEIDTGAMAVTEGTMTHTSNKGSVTTTDTHLTISFHNEFTTTDNTQIFMYTHGYTDKKVVDETDEYVLGEIYDNGERIKVLQKSGSLRIMVNSAGNHKLTGTLVVPLEE